MLTLILLAIFLLLTSTLALVSTSAFAKYSGETNIIRVLLGKGLTSVNISGNLLIEPVQSLNGRAARMIVSKASIISDGGGLYINGKGYPSGAVKITSEGDPVSFAGKKYDGEFRVLRGKDGFLSVVNFIPMEEYLVYLVQGEIPSDWPMEALKAQSVSARSYAYFQRNARSGSDRGFDIESTVLDQVYKGKGANSKRVKEAVTATNGELLKKNGRVIKAFFSSTCGGQTESSLNVWGERQDFPPVKDDYCKRSPNYSWSYNISKQLLAQRLANAGFPANDILAISFERKKDDLRAATVAIDSTGQSFVIQMNDFRQLIGFDKLKSSWVTAEIKGDEVIFTGRGFGHGVGMCQWGAKGMAEAGKNYREILGYYYPGVAVSR